MDLASLKAEECPGQENKEQCVKCRKENERLYSVNKWIMTWVDSVGKMPSGISDGNYHWLGDYEQCQRLKTYGLFNGRYCLLEFHVPGAVIRPEQCPEKGTDPLEVVLGICLPANCSTEETQGLVIAASLLVLGQAQVLVLPYLENTGHHYALLEKWPAQIALNPTLLADTLLALDLFQLAVNESQRCPKRSLIQIVWRRFLSV
uniref:Nose resistant-to-fluoxetine protein N-terminal domain-containing protein n=1 Tax=Meloidogyne javanica TaxID=6303 RepID=A0A915LXR9_MELJA